MSCTWQSCSQDKECIHSPGFSQGFRILIFPTEMKNPHITLNQSHSDEFVLLWLCLSSSSSSKPVSPPTPLNFPAAKKQTRQNQQLNWERRSRDWNWPLPGSTESIRMIFVTWLLYPGGSGILIFPKLNAHSSSTDCWLGTECVILRNIRNVKPFPSSNSQLPVSSEKCPGSSEKCPGCSPCSWRGSTETGAAKCPLLLQDEQGAAGIQGMPPKQQTPGAFQAAFTHLENKQTRKAFKHPLCVWQNILTPTLINPRGWQRTEKARLLSVI